MEWLATILTSSNAIALVILLIVIILLLAFLAKKGILSFRSDALKVGLQDNERTVIRQQIEYAEIACMDFNTTKNLPTDCGPYQIKYINEKIYDEIIKWISFNHITTDEIYIEIKQNNIWATLSNLSGLNDKDSKELKAQCDSEIKQIIEKLVAIRKYYSK